jgi:hypothetical protein
MIYEPIQVYEGRGFVENPKDIYVFKGKELFNIRNDLHLAKESGRLLFRLSGDKEWIKMNKEMSLTKSDPILDLREWGIVMGCMEFLIQTKEC